MIDALNPVSYFRLDQPSQGQQLGFIAQDVQRVFPQLVATTSRTALTPDGTLTVNYPGLIAPIVKAIQALASQVHDLLATVAGFTEKFTTKELVATNITTDDIQFNTASGNKLCLGSVCMTESQLAAVLASVGQSTTNSSQSGGSNASSSTTPPMIRISGANPAHITVGDTYQDLGATAKDSASHELGVKTFLNGALVSDIIVDTSTTTTDTIDYVATDTNGLTSTSTRTVIVDAPAPPAPQSLPITNSPPIVPTTDSATSTATSTSQ